MSLLDKSIARNIPIDCLDSFRSIRHTFKNYQPIKDITLIKFLNIVTPNDPIDKELNEFCKITIDEGYRAIVTENKEILKMPFIFKYKNRGLTPLFKYAERHVKSSIIRSVLLDGDGDSDRRINRTLYVLYHYWFFKTKTIQEATHNVCIDIENIISSLIDDGFTVYKEYTITNELVEKLREKLMSEKLLNMSDV